MRHLLAADGPVSQLPDAGLRILTGREFFPHLISGPSHDGLEVVFGVAAGLALVAAFAPSLRGGRPSGRQAPTKADRFQPLPVSPTNPTTLKNREAAMTDTLPPIDPQRAALLVMDYQPEILAPLESADELLARAAGAIAIARRHGAHVGYVRVAFGDADFEAIPTTNKMAATVAVAGQAIHSDSPHTAIHDLLAPQSGDIVVRKTRVGAFSTTDLDRQLRDRDVDTLLLAGISTAASSSPPSAAPPTATTSSPTPVPPRPRLAHLPDGEDLPASGARDDRRRARGFAGGLLGCMTSRGRRGCDPRHGIQIDPSEMLPCSPSG